jgi:hypothetical protein
MAHLRSARRPPWCRLRGLYLDYTAEWFGKDHNTSSYQSSQAGPFKFTGKINKLTFKPQKETNAQR